MRLRRRADTGAQRTAVRRGGAPQSDVRHRFQLLPFAESETPDDRVARIVLQSTTDDDDEFEEIFAELRGGSMSIRIKD